MQVTDSDAQLQLKKRARRRLVGAVAFVTFAAIVLPMVMDEAPPPPTPDVQIRIPGQDLPPAANSPARTAPAPAPKADPAPPPVALVAPAPEAPVSKVEKVADKAAEKPQEKPADKVQERASEKAPEKVADKPAPAKTAEKPQEKSPDKSGAEKAAATEKAKAEAEAKRASALLGGGKADAKPAAAGQHVILIGAFANSGNVKVIQAKLGEIGVRTYTEPLESPQGVKTRVRAGPFANKDAAEKALEKMKRIGVNGIVSAK